MPLAVLVATAAEGGGSPAAPEETPLSPQVLAQTDYLHAQYVFGLRSESMTRRGHGEMWLSFVGGHPRMRLKGAAESPRFGEGEITIVIDSQERMLYTLFTLPELHEAQCVQYPFPNVHLNEERIGGRLQSRSHEVLDWERRGFGLNDQGRIGLNWTASYVLDLVLEPGAQPQLVVELRSALNPERVVKTVQITLATEMSQHEPQNSYGIFGPPSENCKTEDEVRDLLASVEIKHPGPHEKSSALRDFLLVLASQQEERWPQLFTMLSALTVPGDVAVMIKDPPPPDLAQIDGVAFDYRAEVITGGVRHRSTGNIWLNLAQQQFKLRGEADETKVGPLLMNLIAHAAPPTPKVFVNVNLTVQGEHQCVEYDYPQLNQNNTKKLDEISKMGLSFFAIAELRGEDCGIFVARLARGRWIHIWVDMEGPTPHSILRSEIHKSGQVLRSTDIIRWHLSHPGPSHPGDTGYDVGVSTRPKPEWACTGDPGDGNLAHLGLQRVHKRSIQLQDTMYALQQLQYSSEGWAGFTVLEVLGLTGDVAIMVAEPRTPAIWPDAVTFSFSLYLGPANGDPAAGSHTYTAGSFAADTNSGRMRIVARAQDERADRPPVNISIAVEPQLLAVRVEEGGSAHCLTLSLDDGIAPVSIDKQPIFDGVEAIGEEECNRFTFLGSGDHEESVEFWYSPHTQAVCRLEVLPPPGPHASRLGAMIDVPHWEPRYLPSVGAYLGRAEAEGMSVSPKDWGCKPANESKSPWLRLLPQARGAQGGRDAWRAPGSEELPAALALAKLSEASGVIGLMRSPAANALSRMVVTSPSHAAAAAGVGGPSQAPNVDILGPDLRFFSFAFDSTYPSAASIVPPGSHSNANSALLRKKGEGELRVDLVRRRLYLRSMASNVSSGIAQVESRVIYLGDEGRLYAWTKMGATFEQCWVMQTRQVPLANEHDPHLNPFARGKEGGVGFVPGAPGDDGRKCRKYWYHLDSERTQRVSYFVDDDAALAAVFLDDLYRDTSVNVLVRDWSTATVDDVWFTRDATWNCQELVEDKLGAPLADWSLINAFLPPMDPMLATQRRLIEV